MVRKPDQVCRFWGSKIRAIRVSPAEFVDRRVDLIARGLNVPRGTDLTDALITYLGAAQTETARELAQKAVVLLEPRVGAIIWPQKEN